MSGDDEPAVEEEYSSRKEIMNMEITFFAFQLFLIAFFLLIVVCPSIMRHRNTFASDRYIEIDKIKLDKRLTTGEICASSDL